MLLPCNTMPPVGLDACMYGSKCQALQVSACCIYSGSLYCYMYIHGAGHSSGWRYTLGCLWRGVGSRPQWDLKRAFLNVLLFIIILFCF